MAGAVTQEQAEGFWNKYNKDGNKELTVEEVKACLQEVYDTVDEKDIEEKFAFFGQKEAKSLNKDEFMKGMLRAEKNKELKDMFTKMDTDCSGSLSKDELKSGLAAVGFEGEQADIILDELEYDDDETDSARLAVK